MKLLISLDNTQVEVILEKNGQKVDESSFVSHYDLTENLLPTIDKLLAKNQLKPQDIAEASFSSNIADSYTSHRICQVVVETFNWVKKGK